MLKKKLNEINIMSVKKSIKSIEDKYLVNKAISIGTFSPIRHYVSSLVNNIKNTKVSIYQ